MGRLYWILTMIFVDEIEFSMLLSCERI